MRKLSEENESIDNYIQEIDNWLPYSINQKKPYLENVRMEVLEAIRDTNNSNPNIAYGDPYEIAKGLSLSQDWNRRSSGWLFRVYAFMIDVAIIVSLCFTYLLVGFVFIFGFELQQALNLENTTEATILLFLIYVLGAFIIYSAYFIVLEKSYSCTLGKKILRLQAVDKSGVKLTWKQSIFRNITKLPGIVEFLVFDIILGVLFTKEGEERHGKATDILTETKIVRIKLDTEGPSNE
ncbi:MAG: RDD family protein [Candidatus Kariarchaeaceae archaeon]